MWKVLDPYPAPPITFKAVNPLAHLSQLTWSEVAMRRHPPILLIPVGSTEQHGPHLPLTTDTIIATALAEALITRLTDRAPDPTADVPCLIGPSLHITASGEHQGFPGTISLGTAATSETLIEMARSTDWAAGLVLINGHGGNYHAVTTAVEVLAREQRTLRAWWPRIPGGDLHAGHTETSLMLHLRPDLVHMHRAVAGPSPDLRTLESSGVIALSPSGVLGDPRTASAEEGHAIFEALSDDLALSLQSWFGDAISV